MNDIVRLFDDLNNEMPEFDGFNSIYQKLDNFTDLFVKKEDDIIEISLMSKNSCNYRIFFDNNYNPVKMEWDDVVYKAPFNDVQEMMYDEMKKMMLFKIFNFKMNKFK